VGVLRETGAAASLVTPPSIPEIGAALRTVGADAIVYPLPGEAGPEPGRLLTLAMDGRAATVLAPDLRIDEDGPVRAFAARIADGPAQVPVRYPAGHPDQEHWRRRLDELCDWAWPRAIQPLLDHGWGADRAAPARLVLVPSGELGVVPWHAARSPHDVGRGGARAYACERLVLSYAASARQLVDAVGREAAPPTVGPVFVADPTVRSPATIEASVTLRGRLVVLSDCESDLDGSDYDEALTLATAFLSAGAASVVGARWQLDREIAGRPSALLMFMFHRSMVVDGALPVDALRAAQLWMLDPDRPIPAELPPALRADLARLDLTHPAVWAAFTHQGR
jgi:hypothetical protein